MREHPLLFNGPMVRAILAGQKTQTRRVMKHQPRSVLVPGVGPMLAVQKAKGTDRWLWPNAREQVIGECPFGKPGDLLWVRETWRPQTIHSCAMDTCDCDSLGVTYAADGEWIPYTWWNEKRIDDDWYMPASAARGNVPSIHMPRWACRLILEITAVRVERLHAISEADAIAEGAPAATETSELRWQHYVPHARGFINLWNSTGGDWDSNPWVWVIEFKVVSNG